MVLTNEETVYESFPFLVDRLILNLPLGRDLPRVNVLLD